MTLFTRTIPVFAALAALAPMLASPAHSQSVPEQIELGLHLYQDGEYGAAITELEFAINDIRNAMSQGLAFPFKQRALHMIHEHIRLKIFSKGRPSQEEKQIPAVSN